MLIFRYLTAEVLKSQLAVFLILMTIFVSQKFVKILGEATDGGTPTHLVLSYLMLKLPQLAVYILPLSVFLGIILAYSRIYADSEMTVFRACGVSEWYVVRMTLISSIILSVITGAISIYIEPWSREKEYQLEEQANAEAGLSSIRAGRFQNTGNDKAVVFVHEVKEQGKLLEKVFVAQLPEKETNTSSSLVFAKEGRIIEQDSGSETLQLTSGSRYEVNKHSQSLNKTQFSTYQVQIKDQDIEQQRRKLEAIPTLKLLEMNTPEAHAQFQLRVSIPLSIIILTLMAVPLSVVNPREGKFAKLVPAICLYLAYFILLNAGKFLVAEEKLPVSLGLWWIHLSGLFVGVYLIMKGRPLGVWLRSIFTKRVRAQ